MCWSRSSSVMFQFLIGTLKTEGVISLEMAKKLFQFLIGTLKTGSSKYGY